MRIAILGDIHGQWHQAERLIEMAAQHHAADAAIQVGDYHIGPYLEAHHPRYSIPVHVIGGNHDDWPFLFRTMSQPGRRQDWIDRFNLHYQSRGSVAEVAGIQVGFLGGAEHIDVPQIGSHRVGRPAEYPAEYANQPTNLIRPWDIARAIELWNAARPPLIITHTAPGIPDIQPRNPGSPWTDHELEFIRRFGLTSHQTSLGAAGLTLVRNGLDYDPARWLYGHFHNRSRGEVSNTAYQCMGVSDGFKSAPGIDIYDTVSNELIRINARKDNQVHGPMAAVRASNLNRRIADAYAAADLLDMLRAGRSGRVIVLTLFHVHTVLLYLTAVYHARVYHPLKLLARMLPSQPFMQRAPFRDVIDTLLYVHDHNALPQGAQIKPSDMISSLRWAIAEWEAVRETHPDIDFISIPDPDQPNDG